MYLNPSTRGERLSVAHTSTFVRRGEETGWSGSLRPGLRAGERSEGTRSNNTCAIGPNHAKTHKHGLAETKARETRVNRKGVR